MSQPEQDILPQQPAPPVMDETEFASRIKARHPEYQGMDDTELTRRVLDKYPEYQASVRLSQPAPQPLASAVSMARPAGDQFNPQSGFNPTVSPSAGQLNPQTQSQPMDEHEFAAQIKAKYPDYQNLDDAELSRRMLSKYPDYRPLVRLSDSALKPNVTSQTREDVDFNAPLPPAVEDFKPVEFTPFHNSDMNIPARLAAGAAELGGADNPADRAPATSPDLYGKPVTLSLHPHNPTPTDDELADALFSAISPAALRVNQRYRAETGRDLALPHVDRTDLEQYQDSSGSYQIPITPTQELYRAINAYGHGGMQELESEMARMQAERQQIADAESKRTPEDVSPLRKGVAGTMMTGARIMNNLKGVVSDNPGEVARDAQFIQDAQRSIPEPQTTAGRIVRGVTGGVTSLPLYMNPAAPVVAYTENLDRGPEAAVESALPLVVAGGVGRGVGAATSEMSLVVRQVLSRLGWSDECRDRLCRRRA